MADDTTVNINLQGDGPDKGAPRPDANSPEFAKALKEIVSAAARVVSAGNSRYHNSDPLVAIDKLMAEVAKQSEALNYTVNDARANRAFEQWEAILAELTAKSKKLNPLDNLRQGLEPGANQGGPPRRPGGGGGGGRGRGGGGGGGGGKGDKEDKDKMSFFEMLIDNFARPLTKASFTTTLFRNNAERAAAAILKASYALSVNFDKVRASVKEVFDSLIGPAIKLEDATGMKVLGPLFRLSNAVQSFLGVAAKPLATIGVSLAVFLGVVVAATAAVAAFNQVTESVANRIQNVSPDVQIAQAQIQLSQLQAALVQSQAAGQQVAQNMLTYQNFSEELQRTQTNFLLAISPFMNGTAEGLISLLKLGNKIAEYILGVDEETQKLRENTENLKEIRKLIAERWSEEAGVDTWTQELLNSLGEPDKRTPLGEF